MGTEDNPQVLNIERRAVMRYLMIVLGLGVPLLTVPAVLDHPGEPYILAMVYLLLLANAVVTARRAGPGGVRRLFSGMLRWRIGWGKWALVAGVLPVATITVAALSGTLVTPTHGWFATARTYVFLTFVFGALVINLWEELGWQGLVQRHFTRDHGLVKAAALTAIPFAILHLPLQFVGATSTGETLFYMGLLFVMAPPLRYLLGRTDLATGGSLLAVGVLHASFNASGSMDIVDGTWQHIAGLAVVAAVALGSDLVRSRMPVRGVVEPQVPPSPVRQAVSRG